MTIPSRFSIFFFHSSPPEKPPSFPFAASTRWHGKKNRNRVCSTRAADSAGGFAFANRLRQFSVGSTLAGRDFPELVPDAPLKISAGRKIKRRQFARPLARERTRKSSGDDAMPIQNLAGHGGR
jgi:hypothetical protein